MCRIVLMNKRGEQEIEKIYGLDKYLLYLEKQLGGHGNGFALVKNKKIIKMEKGVYLDVRDIANVIRQTSYDWCLFHTRLASTGDICDKNCHPFQKNDFVLAMNGTESSVSFLSNVRDITDTEAIIETITKYNLNLTALKNFSSIFMGFFRGNPFVVANNTKNIKILKNKRTNALVFASSFPYEFKNNIYKPRERFLWNLGALPKNLEKYKPTRLIPFKYINSVYNKGFGQCYIDTINEERGNIYDDSCL